MHINSLDTYYAEKAKLSQRAVEIYEYLDRHPQGLTDRQIRNGLYPGRDLNAVRPRLTEMVSAGWLIECGSSTEDGRTVRIVRTRTMCEIMTPAEDGILI
jgi:hypothetical protein